MPLTTPAARWPRALAALVLVAASLIGTARPALAAPTELFFSEYIEGTSNNKALEIYNGTGAAVNLGTSGYNVQMYFNGSASAGLTINLVGTIANGDVFVLAQSSAAAAILSQADQTNGAGWFNGDDAVVLRKGTTIIDVIGQIGVDPGTEWGIGLTSTADNTLRRKVTIEAGDANGTDSFDPSVQWDGFATDTFGGLGSHSTTPEDTAPAVSSTVPTNGATNVSAGINITVNFSEPVNVDTAQITLECPTGTSIAFNVADATEISSLLIDPTNGLPFNTSCTLTIPAGAVHDVDGNDPPDTLVATFSTGFTTEENPCALPATKISAIQGSDLSSSKVGQNVTVQAVVTSVFPGLRGFYIQEEPGNYDSSSATSEGLFVFTNSTPTVAVGDQVRVNGTVSEFGTDPSTVTELTTPAITECGPGETITPTAIQFPVSSVSDFEAYEGMLVRFPQQLFIAEYFNYDRFGEIVLGLPLDGYNRFYNPTSIATPGPAAQALLAQYELRQITLDDGSSASSPTTLPHPNGLPFSATNRFRGGDTITGQVGVIDNSFGIYRVHPVQAGTYTAVNPRPAAPAAVGGSLKVASYNVLNYFLTVDTTSSNSSGPCGPLQNQDCRGADSTSEFARQRSKLIEALKTIDADIFGLIELENTTGRDTPGDIVAGLNAATSSGMFARIDTGTIGTDAIRVGIIYKPGKVTPTGAFKLLDSTVDPRFIDTKNRPSLAQTFTVNATGAKFTLVVNHLKSKGSDCNDIGDPDTGDGQGNCNLTRVAAAQALVDWLATDPTGSGDPDFLVIGDMNSYANEDPITAIRAGADNAPNTGDDFINLVGTRLGPLAYSYVFDGQAGYLDHALASTSLNPQVTGVTDWHLNADEPDIFDYNDTVKDTGEATSEVKGFDVTNTSSPFRTSDHDPVIIGLNPNAPPTVDAGGPYPVTEGASITVSASGSDPNPGDTLSYAWDLDNNGSFETPGQSVTFTAPANSAPATLTINVRVTDNGGLTAVDSARVNVLYNFAGFFQPIDNLPTVNTVKAGQSVPVKFSLNGDQGLYIFAAGYPASQQIACDTGATIDDIEQTDTPGASGLSYDPSSDQTPYVWKTENAWAGTCRQLIVVLNDGSTHTANFKFK